MRPTRRTIGWATTAVAALLALPLVASARSGSSTAPDGFFHGGGTDQAQDHDTMMAGTGMDHDTMMAGTGMDHDTMMAGTGMDHDTMMAGTGGMGMMMGGEGMGTMPNGPPSSGMMPAGPAGHEGHHGGDSTGSESP